MPLDVLADGLAGFAHPIRIRALVLMDRTECTPKDIAEWLGTPLGVTAYHVRMLRQYGLVRETRSEARRGALAHYYERTELAETLLTKLNGTLALPNVGRAGNDRRRELLAEWAVA